MKHLTLFAVIAALILPVLAVDVSVPRLTAPLDSARVLRLEPRTNLFQLAPEVQVTPALRKAAAANVIVRFLRSGETGYWGDPALDWPDAASNAVLYAVAIWAAYLNSPVPVKLEACWTGSLGPGILGHSGAVNYFRDFAGAPVANTWYPVALANALSGSDLDPTRDDFAMAFSSTFSWYYSTDGHPPGGQVDLVSVVLHEVCHGLGFAGSMNVTAGVGAWGRGTGSPFIYDRFTENGAGQALLDTSLFPNPSVALRNELTSQNIYFNGMQANAANGGTRPKLYCPAIWQDGSSYSHLDNATYDNTSNALMTSSIASGEAIHIAGPVTLGILDDEGWVVVPEAGGLGTAGAVGLFTIYKLQFTIWRRRRGK